MRKTRLAPRFRLWLVLGITAVLIVTALLALRLVWGPVPVVETPSAAAPHGDYSQARPYPDRVAAMWPAVPPSLAVPLERSGARANGNQMVLALGSGVALALSIGVLWAARQYRIFEIPGRDASGLNTRGKAFHAIAH